MNNKYLSFLILVFCINLVSCSNLSEEAAIKKYASKESGSKFLDIDGKKLHYRSSGSGENLLLLHGVVDSLQTWDLIVPELEKQFRVIRIDIPGFGLSSPMPLNGDLIQAHVKYLNKVLKKLNIDKTHIMGNSLGGLLAWTYALYSPNKVKKVILLDSAAFEQKIPWIFDVSNSFINFCIRRLGHLFLKPSIELIGPKVDGLVGEHEDQEFVKNQFMRIANLMTSTGNIKSYTDVLEQAVTYEFKDSKYISNLQKDILIVHGKKDKIISFNGQIPRWKKAYPRATYHIFENGAHMPQWESPLKLIEITSRFLKK